MGEIVENGGCNIDIPADFKPTLPPRKRAKTQEEKEQRRIERILRNRKAAHHSREKKRMHLQVLEQKCHVMEQILSKIGNLEEVLGDDEEGLRLVKEYSNMAGECPTPRSSCSPMTVVKHADLSDDLDVSLDDAVTPWQQQREDSDFLNVAHSSSASSSSFSPNMALTPVSFGKEEKVEEEEEQHGTNNWDLLLTNEENTYTTAMAARKTTNAASPQQEENNVFPQLWLPFDGTEDSSFGLDDWRNPAVITAITCN